MKNLAGDENCDRDIERELTRCKIEIVRLDTPIAREVAASITGKLGPFTLERAWYYWRASGPMPLAAALEMYADPVGKTDVRVAGHCGCPAPEAPWVDFYDANGRALINDPDGKQAREWDEIAPKHFPDEPRPHFVPDAAAVAAKAFVESYHIDSEIGLRLFADTVRKYGLDK